MKKSLARGCRRKEVVLVVVSLVFAIGSLVTSWIASEHLGPTADEGRPLSKLPSAAMGNTKSYPKRKTMSPRESSQNSVGFVHVGKTGGSTVSQFLRNGCTSFVSGPCRNITNESIVSKMVEHYYHVPDFHRLPTSNHKVFIITIRDVYERTVSSFLYHHPKNAEVYHVRLTKAHAEYGPLAYGCFDTLEDFAGLVHVASGDQCNYPHRHNVVDATDCAALACAALHGRVRFFIHLFFNFRNILYTKLPQDGDRKFFVLRQERLWKDWEDLNRAWGQEEVYIPTSDHNQRNVSGVSIPITRTISSEGRHQLCKALVEEYVAYFRIIHLAQNMNQADLNFSIEIARKNCPGLDFTRILNEASKS